MAKPAYLCLPLPPQKRKKHRMVTMFFCFYPAVSRKTVQSTYLHTTGTDTFQVPILPQSVAKKLATRWADKEIKSIGEAQ